MIITIDTINRTVMVTGEDAKRARELDLTVKFKNRLWDLDFRALSMAEQVYPKTVCSETDFTTGKTNTWEVKNDA